MTLYSVSCKTGICKIDFCIDYEQLETHFEVELAPKVPNAEKWVYKRYKRKTFRAAHEKLEALAKEYEIN